MWYDGIFESLLALRDEERAPQMSAYMRNQFPFLGIATGPRKAAYKKFLATAKKEKRVDFDFVDQCFERDEREFQYAGVDYLLAIQNCLGPEDLPKLKQYIQTKSWWDTVDGLDGVVGSIVQRYPECKSVILKWSVTDDIWLRRVAIDHQLGFKGKTDTALLAEIIQNNLNQKEFFINKAIGWSLRDFSKTAPDWVSAFISEHKDNLSNLSIREGSKYV